VQTDIMKVQEEDLFILSMSGLFF